MISKSVHWIKVIILANFLSKIFLHQWCILIIIDGLIFDEKIIHLSHLSKKLFKINWRAMKIQYGACAETSAEIQKKNCYNKF